MKGITLIALVITIIVLLILAGVSIAMLTGENGILTQATIAKQQTEIAEADEMFKLIANEWQIEKRKTGADLGTFLGKKVEEGKLTSEVIYNEANKTYTIEYNGEKTKIDNSGTLTEVPENEEPTTLAPGLYGEDGTMTHSWQELLDGYIILVDNGVVGADLCGCGWLGAGSDSAKNLEGKLVIDSSVSKIGWGAFGCYGCGGCEKITSVTIPNSVTSIEDEAFANCTSLSTINYNGTKIQWNNIIFGGGVWKEWNYNCPEITVHCTDGDIIVPAY